MAILMCWNMNLHLALFVADEDRCVFYSGHCGNKARQFPETRGITCILKFNETLGGEVKSLLHFPYLGTGMYSWQRI